MAHLDKLPIHRHPQRGTRNHTIQARSFETAEPTVVAGPVLARERMPALLADPRLTGLSQPELDQLSARPAPAQHPQAEQRLSTERGGVRRKAVQTGIDQDPPPKKPASPRAESVAVVMLARVKTIMTSESNAEATPYDPSTALIRLPDGLLPANLFHNATLMPMKTTTRVAAITATAT